MTVNNGQLKLKLERRSESFEFLEQRRAAQTGKALATP
jgi:hypothetical protein